MIIESLGLVARRENRRELQAALSFLLGPTRVEEGCLSCQLYQDVSNPNSLHFQCLWKTEADLLRHLRSDIYKQLLILLELSTESPSIEFHIVSATQGLELVHATRRQGPRQATDASAWGSTQSEEEKKS